MTYLACTSVGSGSDVSGRSDVDTSAFVTPPFWTIPFIVSGFTTTITSRVGLDASGLGHGSCRRSTDTSSVLHSVAIIALQIMANSEMMKITLCAFG